MHRPEIRSVARCGPLWCMAQSFQVLLLVGTKLILQLEDAPYFYTQILFDSVLAKHCMLCLLLPCLWAMTVKSWFDLDAVDRAHIRDQPHPYLFFLSILRVEAQSWAAPYPVPLCILVHLL